MSHAAAHFLHVTEESAGQEVEPPPPEPVEAKVAVEQGSEVSEEDTADLLQVPEGQVQGEGRCSNVWILSSHGRGRPECSSWYAGDKCTGCNKPKLRRTQAIYYRRAWTKFHRPIGQTPARGMDRTRPRPA